MPHANIWIRKENWDSWLNIEDKSEFINSVLSEENIVASPTAKIGVPEKEVGPFGIGLKKPKPLQEAVNTMYNMKADAIRNGINVDEIPGLMKGTHNLKRDYKAVYKEAYDLKDQLEAERSSSVNQDPDYWDDFNKRYAKVQELFDEAARLKEGENI